MSSAPSPRRPPRPRTVLLPLLCAALALALAAGTAVLVPRALAELPGQRGYQAAGPWPAPPGPGGLPGELTAASSAPDEHPDAGSDQDPTGAPAQEPTREAAVQKILDEHLSGAPGSASAAVSDPRTGNVVAERDGDTPRIPASNQKLLTALAVAEHLDPYERLATLAVGGADPHRITLVAGGDTMLAPGSGDPTAVNGRAGLTDLAERTAERLREDGVAGQLRVELDTSIFAGPALNPGWAPEDVAAGEIAPVAPLAFFSHRIPAGSGEDPGDRGKRPEDAAGDVARQFRELLQQRVGDGVSVTDGGAAAAPADARELARVESAPLHEQAAFMLAHSDNSLAETLARLAARAAGHGASVAGVRQTVPEALTAHGIDTAGLHVVDASGMALADRVNARTLAGTVRALATDDAFGPYAQGLPIGGASGTLGERFDDADERAARGLTRAKTGTLLSVVSLSGYVQRQDGTILVYSVLRNDLDGTAEAQDAVDRTVAALAQG